METMYVTFDWTTEKAIRLIHNFDKYKKSYLKTLTDYELFELGLELDAWSGKNPFDDSTNK